MGATAASTTAYINGIYLSTWERPLAESANLLSLYGWSNMPTTIETENAQRQDYLDLLNEIGSLELRNLRQIESNTGSKVDFSKVIDQLERSQSLHREMRALPLTELPKQLLNELSDRARELRQQVNTISKATSKDTISAESDRDSLIERSYSLYENTFLTVRRTKAMVSIDDSQFQEKITSAAYLLDKLEKDSLERFNQYDADMAAKLEELNKLALAAREAAGTVGVSKYGNIFQLAANAHTKSASTWLLASWVLVLVAFVLAIYSLWKPIPIPPDFTGNGAIIYIVVSKGIIASFLFVAIALSVRNHRAHRHNSVVNAHRQNALTTFETFVGASTDTATKDAVLIKASETVFGPVSSGYLGSEKDHSSPQLLEIVRGFGRGPGAPEN